MSEWDIRVDDDTACAPEYSAVRDRPVELVSGQTVHVLSIYAGGDLRVQCPETPPDGYDLRDVERLAHELDDAAHDDPSQIAELLAIRKRAEARTGRHEASARYR